MSRDLTLHVSLPAELTPFIHSQVAAGQFRNANKVARAGLRLLIQTRRDLEANAPPKGRGCDGC